MIPIWAKDKEGKWEIFPAHLLETLNDGKRALRITWLGPGQGMYHGTGNKDHYPWMHLFTYDSKQRRWVLTQDLETKPE